MVSVGGRRKKIFFSFLAEKATTPTEGRGSLNKKLIKNGEELYRCRREGKAFVFVVSLCCTTLQCEILSYIY